MLCTEPFLTACAHPPYHSALLSHVAEAQSPKALDHARLAIRTIQSADKISAIRVVCIDHAVARSSNQQIS